MLIERREVPMAIILSLVTCGIYLIYWEYKLLDDLYRSNGIPSNAGMDILLSIITCGIYGLYSLYKAGKLETSAMDRYNLPPKDEATLYLILGVFGLAIVSFAILQSNLNNILANAVNNEFSDPQRMQ